MDRKVIKILSILLIALMAIITLSTSVLAVDWGDIDIGTFDEVSDESATTSATTQVIGAIINVIQVVGMGIAIFMLIVMAIKYISAAPAEKAEIKKGLTIYVVGVIVLFAASGILQLVKNFATTNINKTVSEKVSVVRVVSSDIVA